MKPSIRKGVGFGLTSGIITTLGLIVGLSSGTHSKLVVLGGILVIAVADALSDALGMHISQESEGKNKPKAIWESTFSTLFAKFIFAISFIIPVLLMPLTAAVITSIIWGLLLISIFSYYIAKLEGIKPPKVISEHIMIAVFVITLTQIIGMWISTFAI